MFGWLGRWVGGLLVCWVGRWMASTLGGWAAMGMEPRSQIWNMYNTVLSLIQVNNSSRQTHPKQQHKIQAKHGPHPPLPDRWMSCPRHASVGLLGQKKPGSSGCHGFLHCRQRALHSLGFLCSLSQLVLHQLSWRSHRNINSYFISMHYVLI